MRGDTWGKGGVGGGVGKARVGKGDNNGGGCGGERAEGD